MAYEKFQACIDECNACAAACDHCAVACLLEHRVGSMARCIRLDIDCAQICRLAAAAMARGSEFAGLICNACAEVCEACAEECAQFQVDHCQRCAQACHRCAAECRRMASGVQATGALQGAVPYGHA